VRALGKESPCLLVANGVRRVIAREEASLPANVIGAKTNYAHSLSSSLDVPKERRRKAAFRVPGAEPRKAPVTTRGGVFLLAAGNHRP
jgi:hypothetical protein